MNLEDVSVIFVDPKYNGNVGALTRVMKNFGLTKLIIVSKQFNMDEECFKYAMHSAEILKAAKIVPDLNYALKKFNLVIGTSSISTSSPKKFLRIAKTPREMAKELSEYNGKIAILFGRENFGLLNNELERCDMLVTIPANFVYPVMNITHAAAVIFYELFLTQQHATQQPELANKTELETLFKFFEQTLNFINYPEYKRKNTILMFRRLVGRAHLTKWEFYILAGIFSRILKKHY